MGLGGPARSEPTHFVSARTSCYAERSCADFKPVSRNCGKIPGMRRSRWLAGLVIAVALLLASALAAGEGFRWRAQVVGLRATGKIPDLGWLDLARMLRPSSRFELKPLPHRTVLCAEL